MILYIYCKFIQSYDIKQISVALHSITFIFYEGSMQVYSICFFKPPVYILSDW